MLTFFVAILILKCLQQLRFPSLTSVEFFLNNRFWIYTTQYSDKDRKWLTLSSISEKNLHFRHKYGSNVWRKVALYILILDLSKCSILHSVSFFMYMKGQFEFTTLYRIINIHEILFNSDFILKLCKIRR